MTDVVPLAALPQHVLQRQDVLSALERHDFGRLFLLARRWGGISYSRIAEATGIKPERVGSLARGNGSITSYAKIGEVADGLRIPGRLLGLTPRVWEETDLTSGGAKHTALDRSTKTESEEVRALLAHAAQVAMGISPPDEIAPWVSAGELTPAPSRVTVADVEQIEHATAGLRALDYEFGGGACRDAVLAQTHWVRRLLDADASDDVRRRIHLTLADLHNLAGWTSLDLGLFSGSRQHFAHALTHSRLAGEPSLLANVLYRTGRLHLHRGMLQEALRFFQLGQIAAQDSGDAHAVAVLCANEAWTYGYLRDDAQAVRSLRRAEDELARAEPAAAAPWVQFFNQADLDALTGMTHLELSAADSAHLDPAIGALTRSVNARDHQQARSRAFEVTALAVASLRSGDHELGLVQGWEAVTAAPCLPG